MSQTISIKLSGPVRIFLGEHIVNGQIDIRHNTTLGKYILALVESREVRPKGKPPVKDVVLLKVPDQFKNGLDGRSSFLFISEENQKTIDDLFRFIMEKELFDRLLLINERGEVRHRNGKQSDEIRRFIQKYSPDSDDLVFATVLKRFQRHKSQTESLMYKAFNKTLWVNVHTKPVKWPISQLQIKNM